MRIAIVIASVGRAEACAHAVKSIQRSAVEAAVEFEGIVSVPAVEDAPRELPPEWRLEIGARGASAQRNAACRTVDLRAEIVFFFDDDVLIREDYISVICAYMTLHTTVVAVTGGLLADGARERREIPVGEAGALLEVSWNAHPRGGIVIGSPHRELYGCNMAVRWAVAQRYPFDERLPLYSWLEDLDLARRICVEGEISQVHAAIAVHRGSAAGGRAAHLRFGYSQVANPLWLREKGSLGASSATVHILRPVMKNTLFAMIPSTSTGWRRTRLRGNLQAAIDVLRNGGRARPERILDLD